MGLLIGYYFSKLFQAEHICVDRILFLEALPGDAVISSCLGSADTHNLPSCVSSIFSSSESSSYRSSYLTCPAGRGLSVLDSWGGLAFTADPQRIPFPLPNGKSKKTASASGGSAKGGAETEEERLRHLYQYLNTGK